MKQKTVWLPLVLMLSLINRPAVSDTLESPSFKSTVYILEDIHGDPETQKKHIQKILTLSHQQGLKYVATEGAWGYVDRASLNFTILNHSEKAVSAHHLLQQKKLNAAYLLNALAGNVYTVIGVENKKIYHRHIELKKKLLAEQNKIRTLIAALNDCSKEWEKYLLLKATPDIAEKYFQQKYSTFVKDQLTEEESLFLETYEKRVNQYYQYAFKRDLILAQNTFDRIQLEQCDKMALIVGGFHTAGIQNFLEEKGIQVVILN